MNKLFLILSGLIIACSVQAQHKTENLIIVTLDGMRWQEVFGGVDSLLIANKKFTHDSASIVKTYWNKDVQERRQKLFPFLWTTVFKEGQLYGNRLKGSNVNVANKYHFSYPGYNEIFTGYPDTSVNSNDKILNKNINVLEFINTQKGFNGKVAVFTSWDVFPFIFNEARSGIYVNADDTIQSGNVALKLISDMHTLSSRPLDVRPDLLTYFGAREYLKDYHPKVLYIGFDETDDFAHEGMYDQYLKSAHAEDAMLSDLWTLIQSMPEYAGRTTLIVTCDHGRGDKVKEEWTSHGEKIADSDQIWIAAIGPDTKPLGEMKKTKQYYQRQLATTFAALLGFDFKPNQPVIGPIESILGK
ncbi:MAG: phosphoglyceromutase [Saprospiraceae bacterium]